MMNANNKPYIIGFAGSLVCTFMAYSLTVTHVTGEGTAPILLLAAIVALALTQFVIQLRFFLHLGDESRPRWRLLTFGFMTLIVGILVFGSLWIMTNLNYHSMNAHDSEKSIIIDEGLKR